MAVLPAFRDYFSNISESALPQAVQAPLPRLGSGALSAYRSNSGSNHTRTGSHSNSHVRQARDDNSSQRYHDRHSALLHDHKHDGLQKYHKHEEPPAYFRGDEGRGSDASATWSTNPSFASENSGSPQSSFQELGTNVQQTEDAEAAYNYACMKWENSNVTSTASSGTDSWFDIHSAVVQTALKSVSNLSRDELFADFWKVERNRRHYGSQPAKKQRQSSSAGLEARKNNRDKQRKFKELFRRSRHRIYQRDLHLLTCERANVLAQDDKLYDLYRICGGGSASSESLPGDKTFSTLKAPSKDDQLMANIYMQVLSAIVVRSEHEGRIQAEQYAHELEQKLRRKERSGTSGTPTAV